ncbi:MAG TPA: O-antigen ligase family protein [Thermoanaerobaculia bacterium]|nr:O-antigen ligase family protein [Thermoanaerobaculia bacterium]
MYTPPAVPHGAHTSMEARPHAHGRPHLEGRLSSGLAALAVISVALVPLAVMPDAIDRFRVLKEALARTSGILGALGVLAAVMFYGTERLRELLRRRAIVVVLAAATIWMLISTATSTNRAYSADSLVTFLTSVLFFVTVWYAAPRIGFVICDVLVPLVAFNTAMVTLQEYGRWQPFRVDPADPPHLGATGLIDNPNVVGSYMALAAVILVIAAISVRGVRRWLYAFGALCATGGVLISETRSALIALGAALVLIAVGGSAKRAIAAVVAVALIFGLGVALHVPVVTRLLAVPDLAEQQGWEVATSGRVAPLMAGLEMLRDHPVTGVGPGAFKSHYMEYKLGLLDRRAAALRGTSGLMFGEVHNDHVQILAETGVIGYALFLVAIVVLVRAARGRPEASGGRGHGPRTPLAGLASATGVRDDERSSRRLGLPPVVPSTADARARFVRRLALPLAGTLLVLAIAQFPIYVPVTRHLLVAFAGLIAGWSESE